MVRCSVASVQRPFSFRIGLVAVANRGLLLFGIGLLAVANRGLLFFGIGLVERSVFSFVLVLLLGGIPLVVLVSSFDYTKALLEKQLH